jgi:uncharacterized OsmC-like protein
MATQDIAAAMQRIEAVLKRRPTFGISDDSPATARWESGTRVAACHANGARILTDMPTELGGQGDQVTPGWLFRAGLASCLATRIAMDAAVEGIALTGLEVLVSSRSDLRGMLGMPDVTGQLVSAAPSEVQLRVRISAPGESAERLRRIVEASNRCSPVSAALRQAVPASLSVEVNPA